LRPLQVLGILQTVRNNVAVLVEGTGFDVEQEVQAGLPYVMVICPRFLNAAKFNLECG